MADSGLVIDTSIIIEHLRKTNKRTSILYGITDQYILYVPTIVEFELFAGATNSDKQNDVKMILQTMSIVPIDSIIAQYAAELYRTLKYRNQLIDIRDIFIAATALSCQLPLLTLNHKHFTRIPEIKLVVV